MTVFRRTARSWTLLGAVLAATALVCVPAQAGGPGGGDLRHCGKGDLKAVEERRVTALDVTVVEFSLLHVENGQTCLMPGRVEVHWVDADLREVGGWAVQAEEPPEPFPLAPGQSASWTLYQADPDRFDPAVCRPADVVGIEIFLWGEPEGTYVGMGPGQRVCADPEVVDTAAGAVRQQV
ncbi:DUF4232 domain-containing protein [Thermobifida cellulosilytica]|uniref:DUF4232 domain-containing protein n=1 Tax=Thermobifida cellulosilytica TB100 TaxID=665004 RepID=A0A147KMY7_THECS|nr:DUF4232 domain-containing protein [Thermobifida cellulosilytica]KUP98617.1 hypothetical protein AC529_00395 [Thermobifida cellulosilytica TB100]